MNYVINPPSKHELTDKGFTNRIQINNDITAERLMKYGFIEQSDRLIFRKLLTKDISFILTVNKENLKIIGIDVLDDDFLSAI